MPDHLSRAHTMMSLLNGGAYRSVIVQLEHIRTVSHHEDESTLSLLLLFDLSAFNANPAYQHSHSPWWVTYEPVLVSYSHGDSRISGFRCLCHRSRPQFYRPCDRRCLGIDYWRRLWSAYHCGRDLCISSESVITGTCGDSQPYYGYSMLSLWKTALYCALYCAHY